MPLIVSGVGAIAGPILGGIFGSNKQKEAQKKAEAALAEARKIIESVGAPPDLSKAIILQQFQAQGIYSPELEEAVNVGVSKVSQIKEDQSLRENQMSALREIAKRGKAGLTPEERAQFNESRQAVQRDLEAKNQQIAQEMQMRGQGGGGAEIAARMLASQAGADRASEEADRISATASARALEAIKANASMSGDMRNQDFQIESAKAGAQDEFDRFNVTNQIARQQRNVTSNNQAQATNLSEKQRLADNNTQMNNTELNRQNEAKRTNWQDTLTYAQARTAPLMNQANMYMNQGQQQANSAQAIGSGIGSAFGSLGSYLAKQPQAKTANQIAAMSYEDAQNEYSKNPDLYK